MRGEMTISLGNVDLPGIPYLCPMGMSPVAGRCLCYQQAAMLRSWLWQESWRSEKDGVEAKHYSHKVRLRLRIAAKGQSGCRRTEHNFRRPFKTPSLFTYTLSSLHKHNLSFFLPNPVAQTTSSTTIYSSFLFNSLRACCELIAVSQTVRWRNS